MSNQDVSEIISDNTPTIESTNSGSDSVNDHITSRKEVFDELVDKVSNYIGGEIRASAEDYLLLEQLNIAAAGRYEDMGIKAEDLLKLLTDLQQKQNLLEPFLSEIDLVYDEMLKTEIAAKKLDAMTLELEKDIKALYK